MRRERDKQEGGERETVEDAGRETSGEREKGREREGEREATGRATSYRMWPHVAACLFQLHVAACCCMSADDLRE